jgi:hypothetical protein
MPFAAEEGGAKASVLWRRTTRGEVALRGAPEELGERYFISTPYARIILLRSGSPQKTRGRPARNAKSEPTRESVAMVRAGEPAT